MIKPCTILDIASIYDIMEKYHGPSDELHIRIRNDIVASTTQYFMMGDCVLVYEFVDKDICQVHIYSVSRDRRGKVLRDFAIETGKWMIENSTARSFMSLIDRDRRDMMFFIRMIGSRKIGEIPGTNKILYVSTLDMVEKDR